MKKYNQVILLSIVMYIILAFFLGSSLIQMENKRNQTYRVESNRIMDKINRGEAIQQIDLSTYTIVEDIQFLDNSITDKQIIDSFFTEENNKKSHYQPYYQHGELVGYIKFSYQMPELNIKQVFWYSQFSLCILELLIVGILIYLKKNIIQPFVRLNSAAIEISKGHLKGEIKEEKNRYLGRFMWGISHLKDKLDISRQRQLEMLKDKKTILLSLSHDIKTPINLIKLYSKALEEKIYVKEEDQRHAMHQIREKAGEIENYVDEIIRSSREDILDVQIKQGEFYLSDLMNRVLAVYQEQCDLRQIELTVQKFDNRLLKGDIERSQEVFENLFENVFKYGDGRRIDLSFYEEDYCQLIRFFNTGNPVCDNEFNHIFESFFRGSNSQGLKGNGLGLYICREYMRKMEGDIFAEKSQEGMAFILVFR
ncbi:sensor histidine kinase [Beduini massiliensis]|uniref:sensor histidine kinase n=1 Tax=Beduini massiliensis TaxID=1585974 RepID=UPI00059AA598|nr:HAMP domain-containing sensor histidine kinase [Beduini massiliensis]